MVYVTADGIPHCRPLLIFKGSTGEKNSTIKKEMRQYDERVRVQWNPKAYCNSDVMVKWLREQYAYASPTFFDRKKPHPRLLSLDVFKGQKTPEVKQALKDLNITPSFVPPGCTGYVQVLDVAINKPLKVRIQRQQDLHYQDHFDQWKEGKYTVGDRRILLTKWVAQAWDDLHKELGGTIVDTFRKLGLALAVDGSEDHEISVKDLSDIEVGDWHLNLSAGQKENTFNALDPDAKKKREKDSGVDMSATYVMNDDEDANSSDSDSEGYDDEVDGDAESDDLDAGRA